MRTAARAIVMVACLLGAWHVVNRHSPAINQLLEMVDRLLLPARTAPRPDEPAEAFARLTDAPRYREPSLAVAGSHAAARSRPASEPNVAREPGPLMTAPVAQPAPAARRASSGPPSDGPIEPLATPASAAPRVPLGAAVGGPREPTPPITRARYDLPVASFPARPSFDGPQAGQLRRLEERLQQLGAQHYALQEWGSSGRLFRFECEIPVRAEAAYRRHFEAVDADPLAAVDRVLAQVEQWRSAR